MRKKVLLLGYVRKNIGDDLFIAMLLNRYKQYTNLSDEQIDLLTKGLEQRISIFETVMKKKDCID